MKALDNIQNRLPSSEKALEAATMVQWVLIVVFITLLVAGFTYDISTGADGVDGSYNYFNPVALLLGTGIGGAVFVKKSTTKKRSAPDFIVFDDADLNLIDFFSSSKAERISDIPKLWLAALRMIHMSCDSIKKISKLSDAFSETYASACRVADETFLHHKMAYIAVRPILDMGFNDGRNLRSATERVVLDARALRDLSGHCADLYVAEASNAKTDSIKEEINKLTAKIEAVEEVDSLALKAGSVSPDEEVLKDEKAEAAIVLVLDEDYGSSRTGETDV